MPAIRRRPPPASRTCRWRSERRVVLRVGIVPYLVARPLTWGLADDPRVALTAAAPAALARELQAGALDVALASSVLAAVPPRLPLWRAGPVIAASGPIRSVLLFLRPGLRSPREIRTWLPDPASRTGRALTGVLLRDLWQNPGARMEPATATADDPFAAADAHSLDAVQLIGDAALRACAERPDWAPWDLGAAWFELTRLPFVFAGWIGRPGADLDAVSAPLADAAERGLAHLPELVASAGARHPLGPAFVRRYLLEDLTWRLPQSTLDRSLAEFAARLEA